MDWRRKWPPRSSRCRPSAETLSEHPAAEGSLPPTRWHTIPKEIVLDVTMALATAHKSKLLEFGSVELADDFPRDTHPRVLG